MIWLLIAVIAWAAWEICCEVQQRKRGHRP